MVILQCPIKVGTWINGWHHRLRNLDDFIRCLYQRFGDHKIDYSFMGLIGHNGLDIELENGDEVFASHDGTAVFQEDYLKGLGVVVTNLDLRIKTISWHLKDATMPLNSAWNVKQGQLIGWGDNTGFSTGPHLHFGLKLLDANGDVIDRTNGYDGAIDPLPYIVWWGMTEQEVLQLQALEGYKDPEGAKYWAGKPLSEYLKARLADKVKTINETL